MAELVGTGRLKPRDFMHTPVEFAKMDDTVLMMQAHLTGFLGYAPQIHTGLELSEPVAEAGIERALRFAAVLFVMEDLFVIFGEHSIASERELAHA
jgi:hypothetical protein